MKNYSGEHVGLVSLCALSILFSDDLVEIKLVRIRDWLSLKVGGSK
jgi:hypothetical protein